MAIWQTSPQARGTVHRKRKSSLENSLRKKARRALSLEPCEERLLMAIDGPRLLAAIPSTGTVINDNTVLEFAPREVLLRFDEAIAQNSLIINNVPSIIFGRAGADGVFGNGNDVLITPGFIGIGDQPNEVIVRFNENLPDDLYQLGIVGAGAGALRDVQGRAFNGGQNLLRPFELDLAPQIVGIVPQPVTRNAAGKLVQATNQIEVYFNVNDPLDMASAQNREFYQLIRTGASSPTATTTDDTIILPRLNGGVTYSPATGKAVLTFDPGVLETPGTYRLRVGTNEPKALPPVAVVPVVPNPTLPNDSLGNAGTLGSGGNPFGAVSGTQTITVNDAISSVSLPEHLVLPGSPGDPGERETDVETHVMGTSNNVAVPQVNYNFQANYGASGGQLNLITEPQKQRVREVFSYFSYYLGINFVETATEGFTIVTGDPRALNTTLAVGGVASGSISRNGTTYTASGRAIMNSFVDWGASEPGGGYFNTAMHEIGHLLGLGHNYESPAVMGGGVEDGVFPGDFDVLYGRYLWPALGNDINVYRFNLTSPGQLNIETIAERLQSLNLAGSASQLDSAITLYDSAGRIVARNDDYYGNDSFLQLQLGSGTYYVAVTSTGNTSFDPTVPGSGSGGTTQGNYQLRMSFTPTPTADRGIVDQTGNRLDGDNDGTEGGVNNFWFKVADQARTIFVDKAATGGTGAAGSITNPYTRISDALAAAVADLSVVRIVGNGGDDGQLGTLADNLSYDIGFDSLNLPLSDGTKFEVPRGVSVMIDAGAVIKLRGANVNAGTILEPLFRTGGSLQVLGTSARDAQGRDIGSVHFTSYYDTTIGKNLGGNKNPVGRGDWGGLVFRDDSDREADGVFMNYVNQARISYGGGSVSINGEAITFNPIHLIKSRPTITFNTITNSQDAAVSANGDSFEENEFIGAGYHADYSRVGPKIYGNTLRQNTINGLFIRVPTLSDGGTNNRTEKLTVQARLANIDIVHVLSETLTIQGGAGGLDKRSGVIQSRGTARLQIDPGIIMKMGSGRFETEMGANLIAEGTPDRPIIFTSWFDDRYGAGGSSDTTNNGINTLPAPGNWGGFLFGPTSTGSLDYALVAFAGGVVSFEGTLNTMQPVEINQAKVRVTNSTFDFNQSTGAGARGGRGPSDPSTIFIRGAQPVILNNVFKNGVGGAVISVNVNSLNASLVDDWGRGTGRIGFAGSFPSNHGPLIRGNLVGNNSVNGMLVRGGQLTTNSVWDDTDIVHLVNTTITVNNQQGLSGALRLQSSPTESLVVKLLGTNVDLIAGGTPSDVDDRVGGTLQIVGAPGHPVVLTSVKDDTVGAGLTPDGRPQNDTLNRKGVVPPAPPNLPNSGPVILDTTARDVHGSDLAGLDGWDMLESELRYLFQNHQVVNAEGVRNTRLLVIGYETDPENDDAPVGFPEWASLQTPYSAEAVNWAAPRAGFTEIKFVDTASEIGGVNFNDFAAIYIPSAGGYKFFALPDTFPGYPLPEPRSKTYTETKWWGGVDEWMLEQLRDERRADLLNYVNTGGGGLLVMAQDPSDIQYNFLVDGSMAKFVLNKSGGNVMTATQEAPLAQFEAAVITPNRLNSGTPYRSVFEGPSGFNRMTPWAVDPVTGEVAVLGLTAGGPGLGTAQDVVRAGDWGTVRLDQFSNDRNVEIINEIEQKFTSAGDSNQTPNTSQFIGQLAKNHLSADDNVRLGFQIEGQLSQAANSPGGGDVDVYSFRGTAGTTVWLDIDRTTSSLDTVVELIDASGGVVARSDDSVFERSGSPGTLSGIGRPLQIGSAGISSLSNPDYYSSNPKDAGMRVVLPGAPGSVTNYFVRVRSSQPGKGTNPNYLNNLTGGVTKGAYSLQIRIQEQDEFPGSTVRYAEVRYATNGVEILGKPGQSLLASTTGENNEIVIFNNVNEELFSNDTIQGAQNLGNVLQNSGNVIDVAGSLDNQLDVDWYTFTLNYEQVQKIQGASDGLRTFAAMLQINYADGLGRPDTTMSVYDAQGRLILVARGGEIADSLPRPNVGGIGVDSGNLGHGSFGPNDPTIGPIQMPAGSPLDEDGNVKITYYVAITSDRLLPEAYTAGLREDGSPLIRLEPIDSINRVVDDRIGTTGSGITTQGASGSIFPLLPGDNSEQQIRDRLNTYADAYTFGNVPLFVNRLLPFNNNQLAATNPFTGAQIYNGALSLPEDNDSFGYANIVMRNDGRLIAATVGDDLAQSGRLVQINTADGTAVELGDDGIVLYARTVQGQQEGPPQQTQVPIQFDALAYMYDNPNDPTDRRLWAIGHRNDGATNGGAPTDNLLFELDPDTGAALNITGPPQAGSPTYTNVGTARIIDVGVGNRVVGMTAVGGTLYFINEDGQLFRDGTAGALGSIGAGATGLALGPQNVENGAYAETLFAIKSNGQIFALDTNGQPRNVFANGASSIATNLTFVQGLAFSAVDFNLWHATRSRETDVGHGINPTFNQNRARNPATGNIARLAGGASYYFGLDQYSPEFAPFATNPDILSTYAAPGGAYGTVTSETFDLTGYTNLDYPTLYFNYFLDTYDAVDDDGNRIPDPNNSNTQAIDTFRVFASVDGVNWELLATNNVVQGNPVETPVQFSPDGGTYKGDAARQKVQPMWDNTGWRQARVDLGDYAGLPNIRLRFQFNTAGTMTAAGRPGDRSRDRNGQPFEGAYFDDIVVGFASRGEVVVNAPGRVPVDPEDPESPLGSPGFVPTPQLPNRDEQILTGSYQLQIRPGQRYGSADGSGSGMSLFASYDVNDRFSESITIFSRPGSQIGDGDRFIIDDGSQALTFEFDNNGIVSGSNVPVSFLAGDSANDIAVKIANAINNTVVQRGFKVRAAAFPTGNRIDLFDALDVSNLSNALARIQVHEFIGDVRPFKKATSSSAQGQTIVQNSTVSHARQVGIMVAPKTGQIRETGASYSELSTIPIGQPGTSGGIGVLPVLNGRGWMPGVTIKNNLVIHTGRTAIMVGGDPNASYAYQQAGEDEANFWRPNELFLPFARVLNNTVYDARVGIAAVNAASPSILNNIISNVGVPTGAVIGFLGSAIYVDAASGGPKPIPDGITIRFGDTVVGANLYKNNVSDVQGSSDPTAIVLSANAPLFVDPENDNFYLAEGSQAIDSSIDSLQDRLEMTNLLGTLGFAASPIQAPDLDLLGQRRIDDPAVDSPPGVGGNVFKDRGALERADFLGPRATLVTPLDNDAAAADRNQLPDQVLLVNQLVTEFAIQLFDGIGVGIDDSTVDVSKFVIERTINGVTTTLTPNVDFVLAYDSNNHIARLIPAQGLWVNALYTIQLNRSTDPIRDKAQNILQPNLNPSGGPSQTRFVIQLTDVISSGWQNPTNRYDVNASGEVTTRDLLVLINAVLRGELGPLPLVPDAPPYLDVNGDGSLSPSDLLSVINELLRITPPPPSPAAAEALPLTLAEDEIPSAAPLAQDSGASADGKSADANAVAAGLSISGSSQEDESEAAAQPRTAAEAVAAWVALAQEQSPLARIATTADFDPLESDLDPILSDLTGDLLDRLSV